MASTYSRRRALSAFIAAGTVGCIAEDNSSERAIADLPSDVSEPDRVTPLTLAHWLPETAFEALTDALADHEMPVALRPRSFQDRSDLEAAVADGMATAEPPDVVQTVLGAELRRYAEVAEIHAIPEDPTTALGREFMERLIRVDRRPFALPVTAIPMNVIAVDPVKLVRADIRTNDLSTLDGLTAAVESAGLGLRDSRTSVFQLLELVLLAQSGADAYAAVSERQLAMRALRDAIEQTAGLLDSVQWLSPRPTANELAATSIVLLDGAVTEVMDMQDRDLLPFPVTDQSAVVHATGLCVTKRGSDPIVAKRALQVVLDPTVQRNIAARCHHLPGIGDATPDHLRELQDQLASSTRVLPAMSTGCGLDVDRRWRALRALDRSAWNDPIALGDALGEILR